MGPTCGVERRPLRSGSMLFAALLLALLPPASRGSQSAATKVLLDCDPGLDDAVAMVGFRGREQAPP